MRTLCFRDVSQTLAHSRLLNAWGAAAIAGGSSIVNGLLGAYSQKKANEMNLKIARETNENNYKMFQEGNEFNKQMAIDMFNMENEYNDPSAVKERLLRAGFNPAVAMENGAQMVSSGSTSVPSSVGLPSSVVPNIAPVPSILNGFLTEGIDALVKLAQAKKLGVETYNLEQMITRQIKAADLSNEWQEFTQGVDKVFYENNAEWNNEQNRLQVEETAKRIANLVEEIINKQKQGEIYDVELAIKKFDKIVSESNSKWADKINKQTFVNAVKQGNAIDASANASNASARLSNRQTEIAGRTIEGVEVPQDVLNNFINRISTEVKDKNLRAQIQYVLTGLEKKVLDTESAKAALTTNEIIKTIPVVGDILKVLAKLAK